MDLDRLVTPEDWQAAARETLAPDVFDFYAGGAGDEWTLRENERAFTRWVLRPRVLQGGAPVDASTTVLGTPISFPVLVAPWAFQWMAHPDGEQATARAASDAGTVMVVSSTAASTVAEVAAAGDGPKWWQLYLATDRPLSADLLAQAVDAGYRAICWTVDFPVMGLRLRDVRSGFTLPMGLPGTDHEFDPAMTWDDLAWIREHAGGLPVVVKGILTAADARVAVDHGADAVVVSNHGGRQLDRVPAALDALPEVVAAVGGEVPVLVDGGVRRGVDVVMALALGAAAVMVARPVAWGLAVASEAGVARVLAGLRAETENAMALLGARQVGAITRDHVGPATA